MTADASTAIAALELSALVTRIFSAAGLPEKAARTVAEGLVDADLDGLGSHGVMLTDMYVSRLRRGSVSVAENAAVVSDRDCAVVLDAGHVLGHLTGDQAMALAIERARRYGAGVVAVRHGFHFGAARRYVLRAAYEGCIGIVMCNTRPLMPAPGGAERIVGNNPLAIAVPSEGPIPIVLDMATSEAAMGKIRLAEKANRPIPQTWAAKADGTPTTDPREAINGMLLPAGGPKGFGLSFLIDLMCGLLSRGAIGEAVRPLYGDASVPYDCSHLFVAFDVGHFCDLSWFRAHAAAAAKSVRSGRRVPGVEKIMTPGEPEWRCREQSGGTVRLEPSVASMLTRLAADLGVSPAPLDTGTTRL